MMSALSWSARPPIAAVAKGPKRDILELASNVAEVPCVDGSPLARVFFTFATAEVGRWSA
jgi:hypothetical protein